ETVASAANDMGTIPPDPSPAQAVPRRGDLSGATYRAVGCARQALPHHSGPQDIRPQHCAEETSMVVQAYILIQTDVGKAAEVAREIAQVKGVTLAEDVTGPYDVIVRAEARNVDELGKLVVSKVQNLDGITRTLTCPVVHI